MSGLIERPEFSFTPPEALEGLTPQTLLDLEDILYKWGQVYVDTQERRFDLQDTGLGFPLYLSGSAMPDSRSMFITKSSVPDHGLHIFDVESNDKEESDQIFWDKDLTVEEAKRSIQVIDAKGLQRGLVDLSTGERIPLSAEEAYIWKSEPPYYRVSEVFSNRGSAFMVFPGQDPNEILTHFDHPEELVIQEVPDGGAVIVKRSDIVYLKKREEIVLEILKDRDLDLDDPKSVDEILAIRDEVNRRLQESE